jgi:hypothetical protein
MMTMNQKEAPFFRTQDDGTVVRRPLTGTVHDLRDMIETQGKRLDKLEERVKRLEPPPAPAPKPVKRMLDGTPLCAGCDSYHDVAHSCWRQYGY